MPAVERTVGFLELLLSLAVLPLPCAVSVFVLPAVHQLSVRIVYVLFRHVKRSGVGTVETSFIQIE